jgi:hypothetical protein
VINLPPAAASALRALLPVSIYVRRLCLLLVACLRDMRTAGRAILHTVRAAWTIGLGRVAEMGEAAQHGLG